MISINKMRDMLLEGFPEPQADLMARVFVTAHDELVTNGVVDYPFERLRHHYAESLLVGIHGLPLLAANIDFGDGRGAELMARTGARLDGLLRRASL